VPTEWPALLPESRGAAAEFTDGLTFSIVIAAYQAEDTIGQAIESALAQTSVPLEVIVCDDGSTDGTGRRREVLRACRSAASAAGKRRGSCGEEHRLPSRPPVISW
jgi:hypothetical protein